MLPRGSTKLIVVIVQLQPLYEDLGLSCSTVVMGLLTDPIHCTGWKVEGKSKTVVV